MQAYKFNELYSKYVSREATEALQFFCITDTSYNKILQAYPCKLYTPNYFIRIALAILTIVAVSFSGLLLWLLSSASSTPAIVTLLVFLAILCYVTLELLVNRKQYYNAGVDNTLMILVIIFSICVFFVSDDFSPMAISGVAMLIALWLCIRFTDAFMAAVFYGCFFIFIFLVYIKFGSLANATAPLMMMAVSLLVYFVTKKMSSTGTFIYRSCFKSLTFCALITFYASGNYFIVREVSNEMFHLQMSLNTPIPFGWLFWILTFLIPPAYIIYGIRKKDFLVMRTGLVLIAATIFTVKYYYTILPVETEMLIAGTTFIALSYALIKYLAIPRYCFTSTDLYPSKKEALNAEALIIAETFTRQPTTQSDGLYGGGSGGGGGATGEF